MSDSTVSVTNTAVEVVAVPISTFITQLVEVPNYITTGSQGPQGIQGVSAATNLTGLTDISMVGLVDGALLVYNAQTELWQPTIILQKQIIDSGQY